MFINFIKAEPRGLVAGNRVILQPVAAGELVKVNTGINRLVYVGDIKLWRHMFFSGWRLRRRLGKGHGSDKQQHSAQHWQTIPQYISTHLSPPPSETGWFCILRRVQITDVIAFNPEISKITARDSAAIPRGEMQYWAVRHL